ncbi:MAG TPA: pyruvate:ferredoxin (flavodoxin) oxidoreductase, partial [Elusimicrobiales bacterium]|nr:pyruvate:ferredoxin (flavodoxin) oxidoreductase [Elusimicrobiales bacterium]
MKCEAKNKLVAMDGNMAAAHTAHATNEVIAIYPITPSSGMGEISDAKSSKGETNIWGTIPVVAELQSEGGASGAVHGSLTAGALTTTFTASQGLLLMIPNLFKIAGELTPCVLHVSARTVATHALSIFGDHSDVMACRGTGFGMLASANPQEAMDMALISQRAALESRIPFIHFFDGFRTSHELNMVEPLTKDQMLKMLPENLIENHKKQGLNPENPFIRGTAQNPDFFFQAREGVNKFYNACPEIVKKTMEEFEKNTGRKYQPFEYVGPKDAEYVVAIMASGADTAQETVEYLSKKGEKVGVIKVRLYRPFNTGYFIDALPATTKTIIAMDRTKEPGSLGEPLYEDICSVFATPESKAKFAKTPSIIGGRYGLSSKEFTPAMVKAIFDNAKSAKPKNGFTVGIIEDVTNTSLEHDRHFDIESDDTYRAMFYGLGSDGTVGANKNTMKIISEQTDNYSQGYFVYDSKKAGSLTVSHVRFGKKCIRSPYLISKADFIGIHQFSFVETYDMLKTAKEGATVLLNSPYTSKEVWSKLPVEMQNEIVDKKLKFYIINASEIAKEVGLGTRINMIMQTAFFAISGILEKGKAIEAIKGAIKKTYSSKGKEVLDKNYAAVDSTVSKIEEVAAGKTDSELKRRDSITCDCPDFVTQVTGELIAFRGDDVPTSKIIPGGVFPVSTSQYEKR